jgi:hypothetical protein
MLLLVVEDCHAERELRSALESARTRGARADVLTGDALLAMRLRREGHAVRLTIHQMSTDAAADRDPAALDARDRIALDGVTAALAHYAEAGGRDFGPYLQYTLIPFFMRAVRNVTAVQDALDSPGPQDPAYTRIVLVGGGPLVQAAGLVAERRGIAIEVGGGDLFQRATQAFARMKAGRATRWVNTGFRALVLEPGFIWLLFLKGLWRRIGGARPEPRRRAIIVVGDRFTADVIERVRGQSRPLVLAGATQPGRALFDDTVRLEPDTTADTVRLKPDTTYMPLEAFTELADPLRWIGAVLDAIVQAFALAGDAAHGRRFTVAGVAYWPLVSRSVWLHVLAWIPALRHLQSLAARAAYAHPDARLLTSSDVTAYNRVLIDTVSGLGGASIGIQHGITGEPNGHSVVHVDELAAWGAATEPWYQERARQTARFVITGNPRFDALALRPLALSPKPSALFTVTICTGFVSDFSVGASEYENLKMIDEVLAWSKPREDVRVIHKMHPGEELEYYVQAGRALGWDPLKLTTIREPILYDVLEKSDVLVAAYSTTVLESLALGTPAIVFDAMVQRKLLPLDRVPGVTIAYSIEELHQQLDTRRAGPAPDRQALRSSAELRAYISDLDGHATERVAALLQLPSDPSAPV